MIREGVFSALKYQKAERRSKIKFHLLNYRKEELGISWPMLGPEPLSF